MTPILFNPSLPDVADAVDEFLLDHIKAATRDAQMVLTINSRYTDNYVFGTFFWRTLWLRIEELCGEEDSPFTLPKKRIDYSFRHRGRTLRHHRIRRFNGMPNNARRAKAAAQTQQILPFSDVDTPIADGELIIAIVATPDDGLTDVFVGEIEALNDRKYRWKSREIIYVRSKDELDESEDLDVAYFEVENVPPVEETSSNLLKLERPSKKAEDEEND